MPITLQQRALCALKRPAALAPAGRLSNLNHVLLSALAGSLVLLPITLPVQADTLAPSTSSTNNSDATAGK